MDIQQPIQQPIHQQPIHQQPIQQQSIQQIFISNKLLFIVLYILFTFIMVFISIRRCEGIFSFIIAFFISPFYFIYMLFKSLFAKC
jgi:hypothetical protein